MASTTLEITGLTVHYGDQVAVDDLHLEAAGGEVLCVLGPSGCGKSTLLRAVAGLEVPTRGSIRLAGTQLTGLRPDRREVGLMFQDHALFPHRTVADNVAFGPRMQRLTRAEVVTRVDEALGLVEMDGHGPRDVAELSGGEQQRVALARALAPRPRLLMLDEPLGSLDRTLRDRLLDDLPALFDRLGTTVVYVTHDQGEALALADRIALLRAGRLEQVGTPDEVWRDPASAFVAGFLGLEPLLEATVVAGVAHTALGALPVPGAPDGAGRLVILPEARRLLAPGEDAREAVTVEAGVVQRRFAGPHTRLRVRVGDVELDLQVPHPHAPAVGDRVRVGIDPAGVRRVDDGDAPSPGPADGGDR